MLLGLNKNSSNCTTDKINTFKKMLTEIHNDSLSLTVSDVGAEIQSLKTLEADSHKEYIWQGDPRVWDQRAPILFPVIGKQKDGFYILNNQEYKMPMHGFARDQVFDLIERKNDLLRYSLEANNSTLEMYPFNFCLTVQYKLENKSLITTITVKQSGKDEMPFQIGTHTGFLLSAIKDHPDSQLILKFEKNETTPRYFIVKRELLRNPEPFLDNKNEILLTENLFSQDAIVLKNICSKKVTLFDESMTKGVEVSFADYNVLALWSKPGADFLCIEPWNGLMSWENDSHNFFDKDFLQIVQPSKSKSYEIAIRIL